MFGGFKDVPEFLSAWASGKNIRFPVDWKTLNMLLIGKGIGRNNKYEFMAPLFALDIVRTSLWHSLLSTNKNCCLSPLYDRQNVVSVTNISRSKRKVAYTSWFAIIAMAYILEVPPEILVDDDVYYTTDYRVRAAQGMRYYKIVFECWKQGITPEALGMPSQLHNIGKDGTVITAEIRKACGMNYITNYIYYTGYRREKYSLAATDFTLLTICPMLGIAPQDMFMVINKGYRSALSLLADILPRLTNEDILSLYGIAVMLTAPAVKGNKELLASGILDVLNKRDEWGAQIRERRERTR